MNYLAHLFLSKDFPLEQVGNFVGDYVKGKKFHDRYPHDMVRGIFLHRAIDDFTDKHYLQKLSKDLLYPVYGRYAGVVCDIMYDHYLARSFSKYSDISLERFEKESLTNLFDHYDILPPRVQSFIPHMRRSRRLQVYAHIEGIYESIDILSHYSSLPDKTLELSRLIPEIDATLEDQFTQFFAQMLQAVQTMRTTIENDLNTREK